MLCYHVTILLSFSYYLLSMTIDTTVYVPVPDISYYNLH